ncbi:hypothetical protein STRDD10_01323 [Streptococcus sp. DD10]|uniref:DUF2207 domain-containing protein n=1 Tax=Streptococcus sp. DD10 TaxID=1777878 RepID=UPI0007923CBF|nr:DUF2207 domain-containing protein [Streptococcus sp. DD10]KXT73875.1 hypothetical protein STRDD10_01323 [Streptococcus sp. DD10]
MKKGLFLFLLFCFCFVSVRVVYASDVEYSIDSYIAHLDIAEDNSASFRQEIYYKFDSDYNGQYVTLGAANPLPLNFEIQDNPQVGVETNGEKREFRMEEANLTDGKQLKIYNSGVAGDTVKLTINWKIKNFLSIYRDIVEMNWFPISDWDKELRKVRFEVRGLGNADAALYAHRGFFNSGAEVQKVEDGFDMELSSVKKGEKLELHAFWPRAVLSSSLTGDNQGRLGKEVFEHTEKQILFKTKFYRIIVYLGMPVLVSSFLNWSLWTLWGIYKNTYLKSPYPKDARLYEAPQELSPLLVAQYAFNQSFSEVGPLTPGRSSIGFENLVGASLLDFIDRGNITYIQAGNKLKLKLVHYEKISDFEFDFIRMLFSGQEEVDTETLFSQYQIDSKITQKVKNKYQEKKVRETGKAVYNHFKKDSEQVTVKVRKTLDSMNLPPVFRSFTEEEQGLLNRAKILYLLALFLLLVGLIGFGLLFHYFFWQYLLALLLVIPFGFLLISYFSHLSRNCLTQEGVVIYSQWQSFKHMLAVIARLEKAELESIVLWNRILVYATLFGFTKEVSKVMRLNGIKIENSTLYDISLQPSYFTISSSISQLNSYIAISHSAKTFSISSNSGSGGFSGGGFSGGGGGGGGGAF